MNTFRTDVRAWLKTQAPVVSGRAFPFGDYSCVPLGPEKPDGKPSPVGFIMSRGNDVTIVTPQPDGSNASLWEHLVEEMVHWHAYPAGFEDLPPECWYG